MGCVAWFSCREYCLIYFTNNYEYLISQSFLYFRKIILILFLFIVFKLAQRFIIDKLIKTIASKVRTSDNYDGFLKICRFSLWSIFTIIMLSILIGNLTAILASFGLIGFGLTFALQKPILNFVGWLVIITKGIYKKGDRIKVGTVVGDVIEIQVMNTILNDLLENSNMLSGKRTILPNEIVISSDVQNYTADSNYILQELTISITYESNYYEAMSILKKIICDQIVKNKSKYLNKMMANQNTIDKFIKKLVLKNKAKIKDLKSNVELEKLNEEKQQIETEIEILEESFQPQIRIEMLDSAIELIGQFKCPYDEIKKYRTEINLKFMDKINARKDISIAYPHMQLVKSDKTKK